MKKAQQNNSQEKFVHITGSYHKISGRDLMKKIFQVQILTFLKLDRPAYFLSENVILNFLKLYCLIFQQWQVVFYACTRCLKKGTV